MPRNKKGPHAYFRIPPLLSPCTLFLGKKKTDCLLAANYVQLGKDMGEMVFDSFLADIKVGTNLLVAHPPG